MLHQFAGSECRYLKLSLLLLCGGALTCSRPRAVPGSAAARDTVREFGGSGSSFCTCSVFSLTAVTKIVNLLYFFRYHGLSSTLEPPWIWYEHLTVYVVTGKVRRICRHRHQALNSACRGTAGPPSVAQFTALAPRSADHLRRSRMPQQAGKADRAWGRSALSSQFWRQLTVSLPCGRESTRACLPAAFCPEQLRLADGWRGFPRQSIRKIPASR